MARKWRTGWGRVDIIITEQEDGTFLADATKTVGTRGRQKYLLGRFPVSSPQKAGAEVKAEIERREEEKERFRKQRAELAKEKFKAWRADRWEAVSSPKGKKTLIEVLRNGEVYATVTSGRDVKTVSLSLGSGSEGPMTRYHVPLKPKPDTDHVFKILRVKPKVQEASPAPVPPTPTEPPPSPEPLPSPAPAPPPPEPTLPPKPTPPSSPARGPNVLWGVTAIMGPDRRRDRRHLKLFAEFEQATAYAKELSGSPLKGILVKRVSGPSAIGKAEAEVREMEKRLRPPKEETAPASPSGKPIGRKDIKPLILSTLRRENTDFTPRKRRLEAVVYLDWEDYERNSRNMSGGVTDDIDLLSGLYRYIEPGHVVDVFVYERGGYQDLETNVVIEIPKTTSQRLVGQRGEYKVV
jgi:hypothetical protein